MVAVIRPGIELRPMRKRDLARVDAIEQASYPFPWSKTIFADCLRVGYHCRVLCVDHEVAAYAVISEALDEAHLLNLCVAADYRRRGLARQLLEQLIEELGVRGLARLFLEVRPSNGAAITLYQALGFRRIGRRPGYYPDHSGREDALVMVRHLDDPELVTD